MCQMHGPSPKEVFRPTKEDQDRATESMRKFYAPRGEDARRLSRYDRAVELLREWMAKEYPASDTQDFLAEEPK